jgi:hypothetical protein
MKTLNLKEIGLLSISELCSSNGPQKFYIARYQRGYRWGLDEIHSLLIDINNKESESIYCLQPLVATPKESESWELIDGQQRMTTIRIILSVLKNKFHKSLPSYYELDYDTRESSSQFLLKLTTGLFNPLPIFNNSKDLLVSIENKWEEHISINASENNIDNFYLFQSYYIICNWLSQNDKSLDSFFDKLINETCVIWYPILELQNQTVETIFLNLNGGKIKLTSAELIKALFILAIDKSDDSWEIRNIKKNQLSQEWDLIETTLHDDQIWNFITNDNKVKYETRIGLLFDLITKQKPSSGSLLSYFKYANNEESLDWEKVNVMFRTILEWYEDIWIYHRIGFIINTDISIFSTLLEKSANLTKKQFRNYVDQLIIEHFKTTYKNDDGITEFKFDLDKLNYERNSMDCQKVLLIHNIKTIEITMPGQRFPFNLYNDKNWSVEHIHPQNPRSLQTIGEANDWIQDFEKRIGDITDKDNDSAELIELKNLLTADPESKISPAIQEKLKGFVEEVSDLLELHHIGNLALLDKDTNSKIGNRNFLSKRKILLELNESKDDDFTFIPISTVNVFLKKYRKKTDSFQMSYWSSDNCEEYKKDIESLLKEYLPKN